MIKFMKQFLQICVVAFSAMCFWVPVFAASTNFAVGDIGIEEAWTTEHNRETIVNNARQDLQEFVSQSEQTYVKTGVPVEAKLGIVFIRALTHVTHVLDNSLIRFVNIFLIVAFVFWMMFESYKLITDGKAKAMTTVEDMVKKALTVAIWLVVLEYGLSGLFASIMGPIMAFGSYISNTILDGVSAVGGFTLSDSCAAIRDYAMANMSDTSILDAKTAADIMCVPTRMSGFYYGAIKFGWHLVGVGIGSSVFTFIVGLALVYLFVLAAFKFAFVAFGVIADLFLVIILLPFTAIAETVNKTSYKGIAGNIYNGFLGIFKTSSLSSQIKKFIDAAIYFVSLSIVVAIGGALIGGAVKLNSQTNTISVIDGNVMALLLTGALVAYIASHADEIAKSIGGGIDSALGGELSKDVKKLYNDSKKHVTDFIKSLKK